MLPQAGMLRGEVSEGLARRGAADLDLGVTAGVLS
jgi:hypothetical protein